MFAGIEEIGTIERSKKPRALRSSQSLHCDGVRDTRVDSTDKSGIHSSEDGNKARRIRDQS